MLDNPLAPSWLACPADVNALQSGVWPMNASRSETGELTIAGARVGDLAAQHGTPAFIVDEADVRARAARAKAAFDDAMASIGTSAKVYYAGKAFLCTEVVRWIDAAGLSVDVASGGELAVAVAGGIDPKRIGVHGNNKSEREIEAAVAVGVGAIVIDSAIEIERVAAAARRHGVVQPVRLRINSGVHASTHEYLATAHEDQKFGVPIASAPELVAAIRAEDSLAFLGLHSHIGSQIFDASGFSEAGRRLMELHAALLADGPVPELNLGGGFGIAYTVADDPDDIRDIAQRIAGAVQAAAIEFGVPVPTIAVEPGRSIVGPSTISLYRVGTIKPVTVDAPSGEGTAIRNYVSVDGGMSDNVRPALYGAAYSARLANRFSDAAPQLSRVVGMHCESGDIVVRDEYLPADVAPGDLIAVPATGAYGWAMSSNYNWVPRPPVVAVRDGVSRVIVHGETIEDLLRRDPGVGR